MRKFIRTERHHLNPRYVKQIGPARFKDDGITYAVMDDGMQYVVSPEQLAEVQTEIIPAQPGFTLLYWCEFRQHTKELNVMRAPIIAWRLCQNGDVLPITPVPYANSTGALKPRRAIQLPDGQVSELWDHGPDLPKEYDKFMMHLQRAFKAHQDAKLKVVKA